MQSPASLPDPPSSGNEVTGRTPYSQVGHLRPSIGLPLEDIPLHDYTTTTPPPPAFLGISFSNYPSNITFDDIAEIGEISIFKELRVVSNIVKHRN